MVSAASSGPRSDENAPPRASDAARPAPDPRGASRPSLRAIQPAAAWGATRQPEWPAPVPSKPPLFTGKKGLGVRAGKAPARGRLVTKSLPELLKSPRMSQKSEKCRSELQVCLDSNKKLKREIADLQKELSDMKIPLLNSELGMHCGKEYVPNIPSLRYSDNEDSLLSENLKTMQASVQKSDLRYQLDEASCSYAEKEKDKIRRQAEDETARVIICLEQDVSLLQQQLIEATKKNESFSSILEEKEAQVAKSNVKVAALEKKNYELQTQLKHLERISCTMEEELAHKSKVIGGLKQELIELRSLLDERNICSEKLQNDLRKLLEEKRCCDTQVLIFKEKLDKAQALTKESEALGRVAWQVAEEWKAYAEGKNEMVKILERSIEDHEIDIRALEHKVRITKEQEVQHRMQREELQVELQNVRQQMLDVPSYGNAKTTMKDAMVDLNRHLRDVNNEVVDAQGSSKIPQNEVSEKESKTIQVLGPMQKGPTTSTIKHEHNMEVAPNFKDLMEGSHASDAEPGANAFSTGDMSKDDADISFPGSHALTHFTSQRKPNTYPAVEAVGLVTPDVRPAHVVKNSEVTVELDYSSLYESMQPDKEMEEPYSSDEDYLPESSQFELYGNDTDSDQSLSESKKQVPSPAAKPVVEVVEENELPVVEVVEENELPPLAPLQPSRVPLNYMERASSDEMKRLRNKNPYERQRTATDRRFWSIEQQDLYISIYSSARVVDLKWIDWGHIDNIDQFAGIRKRCAHLGLEQIMSHKCDWDNELIRQFYSTVHITADKTSMTWMADGRRITTNKRAWEERFGIPGGAHTEIHSQLYLDDDDKRVLYTAAEYTLGRTSGLSPLASIANKILKMTIYPRFGNQTHYWNVLYHIVEKHSFNVISLIFGEIDLLIRDRSRTKDLLLYAPYIMEMIKGAFEYNGPRESKHHPYKPRNYKRKKQTKKVGPQAAPVVDPPIAAAPLDPPPSAFQPQELAVGHEAHAEAVDHHCQFEAAGHQPQVQAIQRQAKVEPITRIDLIQVVEDELRPLRDKLASMEERIGSSDNMIGRVETTTSAAPSVQACTVIQHEEHQ